MDLDTLKPPADYRGQLHFKFKSDLGWEYEETITITEESLETLLKAGELIAALVSQNDPAYKVFIKKMEAYLAASDS